MAFFSGLLSLQVFMALVGGALGVLVARDGQKMKLWSLLLHVLIGGGLAAATVEHFKITAPWVCLGFGLGVGVLSGDAVPALKAASPRVYAWIEKRFGFK